MLKKLQRKVSRKYKMNKTKKGESVRFINPAQWCNHGNSRRNYTRETTSKVQYKKW